MLTPRFVPARVAAVVLCWSVLVAAVPACAQAPADVEALRKDIEALKAGQAELRKELDEIKALLKPAPQSAIITAPPGMQAATTGAPAKGSASAPIVLIEFSDYECAFCGRFSRDSYPSIDREYIATGKVRHVFRAFPLESIHKNAAKAHEAAFCAAEQGKYWDLHSRLFANQRALTPPALSGYAREAGLDAAAFDACLSSGRMAARVQQDVEMGAKIGVQGTPLFLIGTPGADGNIVVLKGISGAQPFSVFKQAFDDVLAGR